MEFALIGDSKETLRALIPLLKRKEDRSFREWIEKQVERWWRVLEARAMNEADPVNPQRVFWELSPRLPDNAILAADSGSAANWFARDLKLREGMMASLSGNLATMGCGVPYAIAAKLAFPDRVVIALVGDGAMQMAGNAELITIAKYWKEWKDPRLVILVLNNRDLNQVTWEMRAFIGEPKLQASQDIPDFPYAGYAESLGLVGLRIDEPDDIAPAWEAAFRADRPVVIEARTDPNVPPMPPHISFDHAVNYMKAVTKGDPDAWATLRASLREMKDGFFPPRA
jgi:pyruvate dehydrogenase (quinone)